MLRTSEVAKRIIHFAIPPFLAAAAPLVILPVVARHTSTAEWAALAVGQSVGAVAALAAFLGWNLIGPVLVASAPTKALRYYNESMATRLRLWPVAAALGAAVAAVASPGAPALAGFSAAAVSTSGLALTWLSIGLGRPGLIVQWETLPRLLLSAVAAIAIGLGGPAALYPATVALATIVSLVGMRSALARDQDESNAGSDERTPLLRPALSVLVAGSYSAGAMTLVALSTPVQDVATVASADRIFRMCLLGIVAIASAFQAAVGDADPRRRSEAQRAALVVHLLVGLAGGLALALGLPEASRWLFGAQDGPSVAVSLPYGITFCSVALVTTIGQHRLLPAGREGAVLLSTAVGCVIGVPAIMILGRAGGAIGAAWGIAVGEVVVLAAQVIALVASTDGRTVSSVARTRVRQ